MKKITILIIFLICSFLYAQETWVQEFQVFGGFGDTDYYVEDIVVCQDGGYAFNGYYTEWDLEFLIDDQWGFLVKTDSAGNIIWAELDIQEGWPMSNSWAFVETMNSNFIIAGTSYINVPYLLKRDSDGDILWSLQYDSYVSSMCNSNENIILAGFTLSGESNLRKIDNEGNTIWEKINYLPPSAGIVSIKEALNGNLIGTGTISINNDDVFVFKSDSLGDTLWTKTLDFHGGSDRGRSISEDSDGNIIVTGYCETQSSNYTGFFWYLDSNGNTISTHEVDLDIGRLHNSIIALQDGTFSTKCYSNSGIKLYNFNSDFTINWESTFEDNFGASGDKTFCKLDDGYIVIGVKEMNWEDYFVLSKTNNFGQITSINENVISESSQIQISNYPNPFNPSTTIKYFLPKNNFVNLSIYNIKGQKIKELVNEIKSKGNNSVVWNGEDEDGDTVSSGVYFYKIRTENAFATKKILMLK